MINECIKKKTVKRGKKVPGVLQSHFDLQLSKSCSYTKPSNVVGVVPYGML